MKNPQDPSNNLKKSQTMRWGYTLLGLLFTGIGILGYLLPILPGTVFMLIATYFFSRSSPRLDSWLKNHRLFGKPIRNWEERKAISRPAKQIALFSMLCSSVMLLMTMENPFWLLMALLFFGACAWYVASRPDE